MPELPPLRNPSAKFRYKFRSSLTAYDVLIFKMKSDPSDHKHNEYGGSYQLEKKGDYYLKTLIFDKSDLSYTVRTVWKNNQDKIYKTFPSTIGFCELKHTQ